MLGAFLGAVIVYFVYLPHWKGTEDPGAKLTVFSTMPAIKHPFSNLIAEMTGTFALVLGILALGTNEMTDGLNPFLVGMLIVVIGMALGGPTGYAINPARNLGRVCPLALCRFQKVLLAGGTLGADCRRFIEAFGALFF